MPMDDATIIALSSGAPPAAIGVIRISGPAAGPAITQLSGTLPSPRRATLRTVRHPVMGEALDQALLLWFPGPNTATGEDLAEIHVHGGRAVVAAVLDALASIKGIRRAEPGEFTRRAFANGVMDLAQAEGLADLLSAETESQRRNAQMLAGGMLSRRVAGWQDRLLGLAARLEAVLEFGDEENLDDDWGVDADLAALAADITAQLARPSAERLKDGIRVVLAGPPNAGKSTLLNALVERDAAITSPVPGTTRDLIEAPVSISGTPFVFVDTAGLRIAEGDEIEERGIDLARSAVRHADVLVWLGDPIEAPEHSRRILVHPRCDLPGREISASGTELAVSAQTGVGVAALIEQLRSVADELLPHQSDVALNQRQRQILSTCVTSLLAAREQTDVVLRAEEVRQARVTLDQLTGRAGTEEMLDALFGRFCIGK